MSSAEGTNRRGRPLGRWKERVKEYVSGRGVRVRRRKDNEDRRAERKKMNEEGKKAKIKEIS